MPCVPIIFVLILATLGVGAWVSPERAPLVMILSVVVYVVATVFVQATRTNRIRERLLDTPSAAKRVWVEHDTEHYFSLKADFGQGPRFVAGHHHMREVVLKLEKAGCVVEGTPAWCTDPEGPHPRTR